jgi:hypothetical protein
MKGMDKKKNDIYSLNELNNYNKDLTVSVEDVMNKYTELLSLYIQFILDNIKIKKREYAIFIINRGLDTVTNVFTNVLYYTRNLGLAFLHSQKSFFFYVEFISQISEVEKLFLQLSSRDAMIYVYKKTLFDLNRDFVKNIEDVSNVKFDAITQRIAIANKMMCFIIETNEPREPYIKQFVVITGGLNRVPLTKSTLHMVQHVVDTLYVKTDCILMFYSTIDLLVKKLFNCKSDVCLQVNKIYDIEQETPSEIIELLF